MHASTSQHNAVQWHMQMIHVCACLCAEQLYRVHAGLFTALATKANARATLVAPLHSTATSNNCCVFTGNSVNAGLIFKICQDIAWHCETVGVLNESCQQNSSALKACDMHVR